MQENNMHDFDSSDINSIKDYINVIRQNIVPVLLITFTGLIVAVIYAFTAKDVYTASTALKISKPQAGGILDAPMIPEFNDWGNDRFIANEIEILKSYRMRGIVTDALYDSVEALGTFDSLYVLLDHESKLFDDKKVLLEKQDLITLLGEGIDITQKRGLDIVDISMKSNSPYEAAMIVNCYAAAYEKLNLSYNRQQVVKVKGFLEKQRTEKRKELLDSEDRFKEFQEEGGIIAIDDQAKALIEILSDFESQRDAAKIEYTISNESLKGYKEKLENKNPSIKEYIENYAREPRLKSLQESMAKLETQRDLALLEDKDNYSNSKLVEEYNKGINDLKKKLDGQLSIYKASIFAASPEELKELSLKVLEEEIKLKALHEKYESLKEIVASYEKRFNGLPERTIDYARYKREQTSYEKLYLLIEEKYQEALINEQSTPGNVLIIDRAFKPYEPSAPNRKLITILGLILGLGFGVGFALIRDYFDNTVKTPEDIQKKKINVLAWIPQIEVTQTNKDFEFIVARKPDSVHAEAFRALRTRIQFSKMSDEKIRTLLITSSAPSEGKTTVSVNVAGSFAQAGNKTVVLDCDLRKPRMHNVFKVKRFPGFTDYFFGQASFDEIVKKSELDNLDFISAGTIPPNPSEILGSTQMKEFIEKLKEIYDVIIVDSPPIIAVTDSEIISRLVDASILVVSANNTEIDLMTKAVELLKHEKKSFIGVLLNNFSYKSGYGSYYKYYYYYSHGGNNGNAKKKDLLKIK